MQTATYMLQECARVAPPLPHHLVCVEKFTLPYLTSSATLLHAVSEVFLPRRNSLSQVTGHGTGADRQLYDVSYSGAGVRGANLNDRPEAF